MTFEFGSTLRCNVKVTKLKIVYAGGTGTAHCDSDTTTESVSLSTIANSFSNISMSSRNTPGMPLGPQNQGRRYGVMGGYILPKLTEGG